MVAAIVSGFVKSNQGFECCYLPVAVDTESNSFFVWRERTCLVQVSTREADWIVDPLAVEPREFAKQFSNTALLRRFLAGEAKRQFFRGPRGNRAIERQIGGLLIGGCDAVDAVPPQHWRGCSVDGLADGEPHDARRIGGGGDRGRKRQEDEGKLFHVGFSGKNVMKDMSMHVGQTAIRTVVVIGELLVIEAEQV